MRPNSECMMTSVAVEQTARLEVGQQARHRPIGLGGVLRVIRLDVVVRVPGIGVLVADAAGKDLDEPHAALDQPPRHQALPAERLADRLVEAVERLRGLGLAGDVHRARRASLHAVGELVRGDPRRQLAVAGKLLHVQLVQLRQRIEARALGFGGHAGRRLQIDDRIAGRTELRALIGGRNEAGAPVVRSAERSAARVGHDDVGRQAGRDRAQAVGDPRADARKSQVDLPGLHLVGALHVIVRPPVHRAQERDLVDVPAEVRKELRHLDPALPVLLEREGARHQRPGKSLPHDHVALHLAVDRLAGVLRQRRLRIERIHLAPAAAHEQRDDRGRARLEMRRLRRVRVHADRGGGARIGRRRRSPARPTAGPADRAGTPAPAR